MTAKLTKQVFSSSAFSKTLPQYDPPVAVGTARFFKHLLLYQNILGIYYHAFDLKPIPISFRSIEDQRFPWL